VTPDELTDSGRRPEGWFSALARLGIDDGQVSTTRRGQARPAMRDHD